MYDITGLERWDYQPQSEQDEAEQEREIELFNIIKRMQYATTPYHGMTFTPGQVALAKLEFKIDEARYKFWSTTT